MEEKRSEGVGFFEGVGVAIRDGIEKRKKAPSSILYDAIVFECVNSNRVDFFIIDC